MFELLKLRFQNFNCFCKTKNEFWWLIMWKKIAYHDFLIKFLHLANEAQISESKHKKELNNKLAFDFHKQVIFNFISDNIFQEFFIYCSQIYHMLQMISSVKSQVWQFTSVTADWQIISAAAAIWITIFTTVRFTTSSSSLSDNEKFKLMCEKQYYNCKK